MSSRRDLLRGLLAAPLAAASGGLVPAAVAATPPSLQFAAPGYGAMRGTNQWHQTIEGLNALRQLHKAGVPLPADAVASLRQTFPSDFAQPVAPPQETTPVMAKPIIALCGVHGSGKTTLATAIAEALGIPYLPSQAAAIHRKHGVTASDRLSPEQRLRIQTDIMLERVAEVNHAHHTGGGAVFDRSPLDFAMYQLADIQRSVPQTVSHTVPVYVRDCISQMSDYTHVFYLPPPPPEWERQASVDSADVGGPGFRLHCDLVLWGMLCKSAIAFRTLDIAPVEERLKTVLAVVTPPNPYSFGTTPPF